MPVVTTFTVFVFVKNTFYKDTVKELCAKAHVFEDTIYKSYANYAVILSAAQFTVLIKSAPKNKGALFKKCYNLHLFSKKLRHSVS